MIWEILFQKNCHGIPCELHASSVEGKRRQRHRQGNSQTDRETATQTEERGQGAEGKRRRMSEEQKAKNALPKNKG